MPPLDQFARLAWIPGINAVAGRQGEFWEQQFFLRVTLPGISALWPQFTEQFRVTIQQTEKIDHRRHRPGLTALIS